MQEKTQEERIDELVNRIDSFMTKGGGRMNVSGGEGDEVSESYCTSCCGESADNACNTPVKK